MTPSHLANNGGALVASGAVSGALMRFDTLESIGQYFGQEIRSAVEKLIQLYPDTTVPRAFEQVQAQQQERARRRTESVLEAVMDSDPDLSVWRRKP